MIWEADDFGSSHIISDMCRSWDCRDQLDKFHVANPNFKATLFAIPGEMTIELLEWCKANNSWIQLAQHGFYHTSNYECEKLTYEEFGILMHKFKPMLDEYFVKGFRAPGWQISDDIFRWLKGHGWWVADKSYNNDRRPKTLKAFVNYEGNQFSTWDGKEWRDVAEASHHHVWDVGWNGVYEQEEYILDLLKNTQEFKFVGELFT